MSTHLTEEEQLAALKRWWDDNGTSIIVAVLCAVGLYFGWQFWQAQQEQAQIDAANLYEELTQIFNVDNTGELTEEQRTNALNLADEIKERFSESLYASNAAMFAAKIAAEQNELERAGAELEWVVDRNKNEAVGYLAQQRLAQIAYSQGDYDKALRLLDVSETAGYESGYAELRGDVYLKQENFAQAQKQYETALNALLPSQTNRRSLLQMKLDLVSPKVAQPQTAVEIALPDAAAESDQSAEASVDAEVAPQ